MSPRTPAPSAAKQKPQVAPPAAPAKRAYNSSRRKRQAEQTRADVLAAAMTLFNEQGWAGTTVAAIADAASVAVETVYNGFGSKKALVRDATDASAVGDGEPVPLVERPEFTRLGDGSLAVRLQAGMDLLADINERSAGLWQALLDAAEGDDDLTEWVHELERRRRLGVQQSIEAIFGRPVDGAVLDALWVLFAPQSYRLLVHDRGQSRAEYQRCVKEATLRLLGEDLAALDPTP